MSSPSSSSVAGRRWQREGFPGSIAGPTSSACNWRPSAGAVRLHSRCWIEATINKEGNVINPGVIHGDSMLARAAPDARSPVEKIQALIL